MRIGAFRAALGVLALLAAGCGDGANVGLYGRIAGLGLDQGRSLLGAQTEAPPPERMTRAQIEAFPAALIGLFIDGTGPIYAYAYAANDGWITYVTASRAQTVTLRGAAVTATHGLTEDLAGYRSDEGADPLISPRPPSRWPSRLVRVLRFRDRNGEAFSRTFLCEPRAAGEEVITLAERGIAVTRIDERCASPSHGFVNRYWVSGADGFVWRSEQWIGPLRGMLTVEILKPYRP